GASGVRGAVVADAHVAADDEAAELGGVGVRAVVPEVRRVDAGRKVVPRHLDVRDVRAVRGARGAHAGDGLGQGVVRVEPQRRGVVADLAVEVEGPHEVGAGVVRDGRLRGGVGQGDVGPGDRGRVGDLPGVAARVRVAGPVAEVLDGGLEERHRLRGGGDVERAGGGEVQAVLHQGRVAIRGEVAAAPRGAGDAVVDLEVADEADPRGVPGEVVRGGDAVGGAGAGVRGAHTAVGGVVDVAVVLVAGVVALAGRVAERA